MIRKTVATACVIPVFWVSTALADLTLKIDISAEVMQMMNTDSEMTVYISKNNFRIDTYMEMSSPQFPQIPTMPPIEMRSLFDVEKGLIYMLMPVDSSYFKMQLDSLMTNPMGNSSPIPETAKEYLGNSEDYEWTSSFEESNEITAIDGFNCVYRKGCIRGTKKNKPDEKIRISLELWGEKNSELAKIMLDFEENLEKTQMINNADIIANMKNYFPMFGEELIEFGEKVRPKDLFIVKSIMHFGYGGGLLSIEHLMGIDQHNSQQNEVLNEIKSKQKTDEDGMTNFVSVFYEVKEAEKIALNNNLFEIPPYYTEVEFDSNALGK